MRLPSIQQVLRETAAAFKRFPLVLLDAFVWTVMVLILLDYQGPPSSSILFKVLYAATLGFPLLVAACLVAERRRWTGARNWGVQGICLLLLVGYALTVPSYVPAAPEFHIERLFLLFLAMCLLGGVAPYIGVKQLHGFWHYCKLLIQRILLAGVFSVTLYAGLALALAAVDQLFGVDIPNRRYGELAMVILGVFATWFFLAGVPRELDELESRTDYPRVLKVFGQYILAPLLLVYFVILYAYIAKIIIEWNWPKGMVAGLIFGFAATGIVAYLLLYPIRNASENSWIKGAARWFWIAMIPTTVVLELAIWRRVSEYGITEHRYLALVSGVWLAAMAVYFLASKTKSIKVIPGSICALSVLVCFGPWSAFSVSERNQVGRLETLLTKNRILVDGKVQKAPAEVPTDDIVDISSIISYLHSMHGYDQIQPWFTERLAHDSTGVGPINEGPTDVVALLGLEYVTPRMVQARGYRSLTINRDQAIDIADFDHLLLVQRGDGKVPQIAPRKDDIAYGLDADFNLLTVRSMRSGAVTDSVQIYLKPVLDSLLLEFDEADAQGIPVARMTVDTTTEAMKLRVILLRVDALKRDDGFRPAVLDALILYSQPGE